MSDKSPDRAHDPTPAQQLAALSERKRALRRQLRGLSEQMNALRASTAGSDAEPGGDAA